MPQAGPPEPARPALTQGSISHAWRALRHPNFQLFFFGQSISVLGTWITRLATSWLVYRLTDSVLMLGIVSFAGQIVSFLLGPLAAVWVEWLDRRKLLVWTQAAGALQSLALAALTLAHMIHLWEIITLTAIQGSINAFDMPGRQSFLIRMVESRDDLSNAIAINSSMANGARLIGPAFTGLLIAAAGEGWCFLIDGLNYMAVIASLLLMRMEPTAVRRNTRGMFGQMRERLGLGLRLSPDSPDSAAVCAAELDGLAVLGSTSGLRRQGSARRSAHARMVNGSLRAGSAGFSTIARCAQVRGRIKAHAADRHCHPGRRIDPLRPVLFLVAFTGVDGSHRARIDAGCVRLQHNHSGASARRQAGPRDGLLHDGFFRCSAIRQLVGRWAGSLNRSAVYRDGDRGLLRRRRALVYI